MTTHLIDPYKQARGGSYTRLSKYDRNMVTLFKTVYMNNHGICNWRVRINDNGDARIIEPILSEKEKEYIEQLRQETLLSFERDAKRGYTLD